MEGFVGIVSAATKEPVSVRQLDEATFGQDFRRLSDVNSHVCIHVRWGTHSSAPIGIRSPYGQRDEPFCGRRYHGVPSDQGYSFDVDTPPREISSVDTHLVGQRCDNFESLSSSRIVAPPELTDGASPIASGCVWRDLE